jgi:hypothetical protein
MYSQTLSGQPFSRNIPDRINMLDLCSLQSLYFSQIEESSPYFDQIIRQFLESQIVPSQDILEECVWREALFSESQAIENWKHLLAVNLLCDLAQLDLSRMAAKVRIFERHPWNHNSQYFRSLVALNHAFAKMPIPEVGPHLLESGAALIDLHEYCPWLSLPYTPYHFEFGIFLCLLSLLTKRHDLQDNVLHIAQWQLNTLDVEAKPLPGLFVREKEGITFQHLCLSYLLFRSAAILNEANPFAAIAEVTMKEIHARIEQKNEKIDPLWVLIERWLDQYKMVSQAPLELSENIYDPSTALVGYRTATQHVVSTLHGGHTGLGELRFGDVEIVCYAPQYLPLGDCQGFGIEGNALSDHGTRRSMIEWKRGGSFVLKGCTRLVDQPSSSLFGGTFRGIWLEVVQEFKKPHFNLKTTFLGLDGWEGIAFSFFVKAAHCKIQSQVLQPRTLERYEGETQTLILEGKEHSLEIRPHSFKGTMQVIPLAGGDNFWGADFLVAYLMTPDQRHYQWHIGPPR